MAWKAEWKRVHSTQTSWTDVMVITGGQLVRTAFLNERHQVMSTAMVFIPVSVGYVPLASSPEEV